MKTKPLMNFGDSVRARLLAIAKKENIKTIFSIKKERETQNVGKCSK